MGRIIIAVFAPISGKEPALKSLVLVHHARLAKEGLVTERPPIIARSKSGSILEVFEWKSEEAIEQAHENAEVRKMWNEFEALCTYTSVDSLEESAQLFSEFEPLN